MSTFSRAYYKVNRQRILHGRQVRHDALLAKRGIRRLKLVLEDGEYRVLDISILPKPYDSGHLVPVVVVERR